MLLKISYPCIGGAFCAVRTNWCGSHPPGVVRVSDRVFLFLRKVFHNLQNVLSLLGRQLPKLALQFFPLLRGP